MFSEQLELLKALDAARVRFIIYGGYAVVQHGYQRTTGDLDIWLSPDTENKNAFLSALQNLSFTKSSLEFLESLDFSIPQSFTYGIPPLQFDFANFIQGVTFEEAYKERLVVQVEGIDVSYLKLEHLILSKITSDRTKDKADIEELQRIHDLS